MHSKQAALADLTGRFARADVTLVAGYRGLRVGQLAELRRALAPDATCLVAKNTLVDLASSRAGVPLPGLLTGPNMFVFVTGDPAPVLQRMREFARRNPALTVHGGGGRDGRVFGADDVAYLAALPGRAVLIHQFAATAREQFRRALAVLTARKEMLA